MSRTTARRGLSALLTLAFAAAALLVALGAPAPSHGPAFALTGAGGALTLENDRHGAAILQAGGLRPGDVAEGTVAVWANSTADVALTLRHEPGAEQPGTGGGRLSDRLVLAIDDVTVPSAPVSVYSGPLAGLGELSLAPSRTASCGATASAPRSRRAPATTRSRARRSLPGSRGRAWPPPRPPPPPRRRARHPLPARAARRRHPGRARARPERARRRAAHRPAGGPRLRQAAPLRGHRQAAPRREGQVGHRVRRRQARARRQAQPAQGTLDLKAVKRAKVRVRVVVATSAGTVTVTAAYRLCRRR